MLTRILIRRSLLALLPMLLVASACAPAAQRETRPLTIGVLPDEAPDRLERKYSSLVDRLETALGQEVELIVPSDYEDFVARFSAGEVDIGYFGGLTYLLARQEAGAEPLVMRDVDARFTSVFVSRSSDERTSIVEFSGTALGFGSELSTSGHLMPRHHFTREFGLRPEDHFGHVSYSGAHDRSVEWVLDGTVDIAAVSAVTFRQLIADGTVDPDSVRVVYETPIYVDYVFAQNPDLPEQAALTVRDTLLELSMAEEADRAILEDLGAARFLHAFPRFWSELEVVSREQGLIDVD